MSDMECRNPEHENAAKNGCTACARQCEAELTALNDRYMRLLTAESAHRRQAEAAARRAAQDHMRTWAGLYYLEPALAQMTWPLEETLGMAAMIDPGWGRTKDARERLGRLKARAEQAQKRWWEIRSAAGPAWQGDPCEAEVTRLRQVMTGHGLALHRQLAPPPDGFTACACPGCELIRAMDAGMLDLARKAQENRSATVTGIQED